MADRENKNLPTTWVDVVKAVSEGGLPQVIAGPAGKAISRLIAGAADIPAAWLNSKAQSIKDETDARTTIMKAVAKASAESAMADPQLLDRALARYVSDLHKKQENREAVAQKAFEELSDGPAPEDSAGPSEDWMNVFEEYAEKASSEELRTTWAKVLAGEIRRPTSFSLKTLQFLSVLDKATAQATESVLSRCFDSRYAILPTQARGQLFAELTIARLAGIIGQIDVDTENTKTTNEDGAAIFSFGKKSVVARCAAGYAIKTECASVSLIGQELYPVIEPRPSEEAILDFISRLQKQPGVNEIQRGDVSHEGGITFASNLITVWIRPSTP